ncbi:chromate transporter [Crepidotus variabilis]|uniref:Chromate transporter n=1 Tax=Crepidotus variabilis TaxID=179855 RepID=A0A9P6JUV7_9AGAR|nr:chromate transporter [Crepidotus variabilis]
MSLTGPPHPVHRRTESPEPRNSETRTKLLHRLQDAFLKTFHLGFTCFGGPPVHFQIFHRQFVDGVDGKPWIDEQTHLEIFAVSQALPGPASTKMLFNITQIHSGLIPAIMVFLLWSLPTSIAMFGLSFGVSRIGETLPSPVYALLSGLNSATVGIIALAAVQLARKAITDKLTRLLVVFGACAGMCYNALWYFPVLLISAGVVTAAWDFYGQQWISRWVRGSRTRLSSPLPDIGSDVIQLENISSEGGHISGDVRGPVRRIGASVSAAPETVPENLLGEEIAPVSQPIARVDTSTHSIPVKIGIVIIVLFFATFATFMTIRGTLLTSHRSAESSASFLLSLFTNMFLAGTIIFGGGPVVIPLLRNYVVDPGWVSPRDFLLGLAVIQAMPGPNFNFAVYLGALATANKTNLPSIVGATLAFTGIFTPGLWLSVGFQSIWQSLRKRRAVSSVLRGVNAAAVGFVFTAVYRLWEIGFLSATETNGISLGKEPWWLVVAASTFTAVEWFSIPPPVAILSGGVAGLAWWGAIGKHSKYRH